MSDKEVRADAKLKQLAKNDPQAEEDLWRFRNPEEGGTVFTYEAILVEIPLRYGFTCSLSSLSEFYSWLKLKRRMDARIARADQLKEELARDTDLSQDKIIEAGQKLFLTEGFMDQNPKLFAEMVRLGQEDTRIKQGDQKIQQKDREIQQKDKLIAQNNRRIKLLEDAAAEAKAKIMALTTAAKSTGGLTPETLKQIEEAAGLL